MTISPTSRTTVAIEKRGGEEVQEAARPGGDEIGGKGLPEVAVGVGGLQHAPRVTVLARSIAWPNSQGQMMITTAAVNTLPKSCMWSRGLGVRRRR